MAVQSPVEESLPALELSSSHVQQLMRTNEALLKTNESLKEMVISVIALLRDPTRHVTYGDALRNSESETHALHSKASPLCASKVAHLISSSASSVRDTSRDQSPESFARGIAPEGNECVVLGENVCPMTFQEIEEETAVCRRKYEGTPFHLSVQMSETISLYPRVSAYCTK